MTQLVEVRIPKRLYDEVSKSEFIDHAEADRLKAEGKPCYPWPLLDLTFEEKLERHLDFALSY